MGQKADSITAYYLLAKDTIEEYIAGILDGKGQVLDAILDGKETEEESMMIQLLKNYREEK